MGSPLKTPCACSASASVYIGSRGAYAHCAECGSEFEVPTVRRTFHRIPPQD